MHTYLSFACLPQVCIYSQPWFIFCFVSRPINCFSPLANPFLFDYFLISFYFNHQTIKREILLDFTTSDCLVDGRM
ncbi:hypothetical protein EUTSA_v10027601mg [Eutrema salsugineum]|uniref:Uncharacterized protein n=1 Tax=Eutrema salsugineum TaxID=72664 RepID=V4MH45_EUTSA|nr:hypothetical protein EUTSA_v10027601mg [Eutrema salsugineum]